MQGVEVLATEFRLLSDPVRLRALRILSREELAAGEAADVLGISRSTASKHLAQLREGGFVVERRDGRHTCFRVPHEFRDDLRWNAFFLRLAQEPDADGDLARLDEVLNRRREGSDQGAAKAFVPGKSWAAWSRALTHLVPGGLRAVDLGCGDGALTLEIARFATSVVGVDRRGPAIQAARARAAKRGVDHVRFDELDILTDALRGGPFDLAVASQVLQTFDAPELVLRAAHRALRPGGRLVVLDLLPHDEAWVRTRLGHKHQGFQPGVLKRWFASAGFRQVRVERVAGGPKDPFRVVLATGVRSRKETT
ncbi:MAG: metalloregulator ArsR/SmtB family transcription factor [Planctomycetes bacterium]|nr:metalloregulator ArsR/SmtB family transcription factor [Planctomycetota bacterium]